MTEQNDGKPPADASDEYLEVGDEEIEVTAEELEVSDVSPTAAAPDEYVHIKRKVVRHLPGIVFVVSALLLAFGSLVGFVIGKRSVDEPAKVLVTVAANARSPEAIAKRNIVWRVLNGEGKAIPDSAEKEIGTALSTILTPEGNPELRAEGISMLMEKSKVYFSEEERKEIARILIEGESVESAAAYSTIAMADGEGSDLLRGILTDAPRVGALLGGRKVELEKLPDGTTP